FVAAPPVHPPADGRYHLVRQGVTERPGVVTHHDLWRESGKPVKDGMPVRIVQQPVAGDQKRVRRPDLNVIKTLTGDPSLGTNGRHEGTLAARVHEHDIPP